MLAMHHRAWVNNTHWIQIFRSISTAGHLSLLQCCDRRSTFSQTPLIINPPALSPSCSPSPLFSRLLSSSPSTTLLPPTTTYEELRTALASEDILVVDVRQVIHRFVNFSAISLLQPKELSSDGAIPGAVNIPLGQVAEVLPLPHEQCLCCLSLRS